MVPLVCLYLNGCVQSSPVNSDKVLSSPQYLQKAYQAAVDDASTPSEDKIATSLMSLKAPHLDARQEWINFDDRRMILVATFLKESVLKYWQQDDLFEVQVDCWVTIPGEWTERLGTFTGLEGEALRLRMLQMLGMPPSALNSYMVEFYADADKIFRPAYDPDPTAASSPLTYPHTVSYDYRQWFEYQKALAYKSDPPYPWTQLGYTYDWGSQGPLHFGLSEFVVPKGTLVKVSRRSLYSDFIDSVRQR